LRRTYVIILMGDGDLKLRVRSFFDELPLPFGYMAFPYPEDPSRPRHRHHVFRVNRAIAELTARYLNRAGLPHTDDPQTWNISWGQQFDAAEYSRCRSWQKINHFAGAFLLGRKDELHKRMTELALRCPSADFYPDSYLLPSDLPRLSEVWRTRRWWILKEFAASKAEGVAIVASSSGPPRRPIVVQCYIERPLLIDRRKFDVRLYVLVPSIAPVRVYLHLLGLVRFATHDYGDDIADLCSHLTNVSINRASDAFEKWPLRRLWELHPIDRLWPQFERIAIMAVLGGATRIRQHHQRIIAHRHTSFELFGMDVLVDDNLHCWLLEVNVSPSLSGRDSDLDRDLKTAVMADMFNTARVVECDPASGCPAVDKYDAMWRAAIVAKCATSVPWDWREPVFADLVMVRDFLEEKRVAGGFKRVFPRRKTMAEFVPCIEKLGYCDRAFLAWVGMDNEARLRALERGREAYVRGVAQI
jgi:tubulin polyglutamylase TTLL4